MSHYNRFDPKLGYFMSLTDVLEKFEEHMEPAYDTVGFSYLTIRID